MGFKIRKTKTLDNGEYTAKVTDIQEAQGLYGPCLKFFFEVTEGQFAGQEASMIRPAKLIPGNKLDRTLQSMGIDTTSISDELDVDILKGKVVKVKIETKTSEKGKVFANVTEARVFTISEKNKAANTPEALAKHVVSKPTGVVADNIEEVPF